MAIIIIIVIIISFLVPQAYPIPRVRNEKLMKKN